MNQEQTIFDVTSWPHGNAREDVGAVINSIISHIKSTQLVADRDKFGKPGAVIQIPPGDYRLMTQILVDISFLRIEGYGHGFTSSSIRFNLTEEEQARAHEVWPGGSRILVDFGHSETASPEQRAAILVDRAGSPRLSSIEFADFCIDGLEFVDDGSGRLPQNSYRNNKIGIYVSSPNDSLKVSGMGFIYLEQALVIRYADALTIHDNFIAECGSCVELLGWGQASKITDNLIGAGPWGHSIYAENHGGLLVATNNVFPRGSSSLNLNNVSRSNVSSNRFHSFYPGMIRIVGDSCENLFASNHLLRDDEPWLPFVRVSNGMGDSEGLVIFEGSRNSFVANHISVLSKETATNDSDEEIVVIKIASGEENFVSNNHVVARVVNVNASEDCFESQVGAITSQSKSMVGKVWFVDVESASVRNRILDSGEGHQVRLDASANAFRATPSLGS